MIKKLIMFASFGNLSKSPQGGGQTAARRLAHTIMNTGTEVILLNRHRYYFQNKILDKLSMFFGIIIDLPWLFYQLLSRKWNESAILYMSYCGSLMPFDLLVTIEMKILGYKNIFFYAGGGGNNLYEKGHFIYRKMFQWVIQHYDDVMLEGQEGIELVKSVGARRTFYLPNFTEKDFAPSKLFDKPIEIINIVFVGRITRVKNVLLILEIYEELCRRYSHIYLNIVGNGDKEYEEKVDSKINHSNNKNKICRFAWMDHDNLKCLLKKQHIFLFPSAEPREGHSNALNEAMSWGIVPVVSSNNYLPSIVGYKELVANDYEVRSYVDIISKLIDENSIPHYSQLMFERVKTYFTQEVVEKRLEEELINI